MKIIEASAVISARAGDLSGLDKVASKIMSVSKAGQQVKTQFSGAASEMGKRVEEISAKLSKIDNFRTMSRGLDQASVAMKAAQQNAARLKAALDAAESPTRRMQSEYARAASAVDRAARAFRDQGQAVRSARSALEQAGVPVNQIARQQAQLTSALNTTTAAIQRQAAAGRQLSAHPWGVPGGGRRSGSGVPLIPLGVVAGASGSGGTIGGGPAAPIGIAGDGVAGLAGIYGGSRVKQLAMDAIGGWRDMDEALRRQGAILGITPDDQQSLKAQAIKIGQDTRFTNPDVVKAQTTIGARLPKELQKPGIITGITSSVRDYSLAMGTTMDEGAEAIIARMLARGYDTSSPEAATASARHAANRLVQVAKASGMTHDDLMGYTKFGAAPGRVAGFSEEFSDALAAQLKRIGYEGSMAGNLVRAAGMKLSTPTRNALDAIASTGLNYDDYRKAGSDFSASGFSDMLRRRFGRSLNKEQLAAVTEAMNDESVVGDRGAFQEKMMGILSDTFFTKNKSGKIKTQDRERLAKVSDLFYQLNAESVDVQRLMTDIINGKLTPAVARYLFGQEHGGRVQGLKGDQLGRDIETFKNTPPDRAQKIGEDINAGFFGSYQQAIGAIETFKTRLGEANDGLLRFGAGTIDQTFTALSKLPDGVLQIGTAAGTASAALITLAGASRLAALASVPGASALGGFATGALSLMPRLLGWAGLGYGAYQIGSFVGSTAKGIGSIAAGQYWTPRNEAEIADINAQIAEREASIAGMRSRIHSSRANEPNYEIDRLAAEVQELRNRLASVKPVVPALPGGSLGSLNWGMEGGKRVALPETSYQTWRSDQRDWMRRNDPVRPDPSGGPTEQARGRAMMELSSRGQLEAVVKPDQISAKADVQVSGSTRVQVELVPGAGLAGLIQAAQKQANVTLSGGSGPGSTGRSMPEAAAPQTGSSDGTAY